MYRSVEMRPIAEFDALYRSYKRMPKININDVLSRLNGVEKVNNGWAARCPGHNDDNLSLSVWIWEEKVCLKCHASSQCTKKSILTALGFLGAGGSKSEEKLYPVLERNALYGLAGEIVETIAPHTEADNAALLVQLLAGFGNLIGRTAHYKVGADCHYLKIFAVIVGLTARGRKGTSWAEIERLLVRADESFKDCLQDGLSTGEGLIYHARDEQTKKIPVKQRGRIIDYQDEVIDEGAKEKRAFVIEPEFARVLKVFLRHGNTLSSVIRQAWDSDRLRTMTKNPVVATETHISIVGHITKEELVKNLSENETANGFANRFLWLCVRRSKYLPDGGNLAESEIGSLVEKLRKAVEFAVNTKELKRDEQANELWQKNYKKLSDGYTGLLGSITSRATAQVMRLACIYALVDLSAAVRVEHLQAAISLWRYCEDSAKYIFGINTGDKLADEISDALQANTKGMTKTEITNHFNRNRTTSEIENALEILLHLEKIEKTIEKTLGRPREIFRAMEREKNEISEAVSPKVGSEDLIRLFRKEDIKFDEANLPKTNYQPTESENILELP